jgi:MbnP
MRLASRLLKSTFILLFGILLFIGCKSDDETVEPTQAPNLSLVFSHLFNGERIELDKIYLTANQDSFLITEHKYIVSNIVLRNTTKNKEFEIPDSHFLVKVPSDTNIFIIEIEGSNDRLPNGTWDQIDFLIGLDSATNFAPKESPILFSDEAMHWNWDLGYKFLVAQGKYYSKNLPFPFTGVVVHIGTMTNLVKLSFDLSSQSGLSLKNGKTCTVDFKVNVDELFFNPNMIDLANSNYWQIMGGPLAVDYRENYSNNYWVLNQVVNP